MRNLLPALFALAGSLAIAQTAAGQTSAFVKWPLTTNASDNAAVRSVNVTPGTPVFRRYVISNGALPTGTGNQAFPAYSSVGQTFAPVADGGGWSSTVSTTYPVAGTGGSPRRRFYEQFSLTATGASVRVDSAVFNMNIFNSAAGKVAVAWSTSNFASDSSSVSGGKGPAISNNTNTRAGGALATTENGMFGVGTSGTAGEIANNAALLPQTSTAVPSVPDLYSFALNGATGVTLTVGQTLTVRLYVAVGSSSGGRYVLLRNMTLKSQQVALATRAGVQTNLAVYPNPAQNRLNVSHIMASRDAHVTVFNTTGAQIATFATQPGTTETAVDLGALTMGLYLVEYADGAQRSSTRIMKE